MMSKLYNYCCKVTLSGILYRPLIPTVRESSEEGITFMDGKNAYFLAGIYIVETISLNLRPSKFYCGPNLLATSLRLEF
jgi:hypothetical protein